MTGPMYSVAIRGFRGSGSACWFRDSSQRARGTFANQLSLARPKGPRTRAQLLVPPDDGIQTTTHLKVERDG